MKNNFATRYATLHRIYLKHRRMYRENGDSRQMWCLWSTGDPPDIIAGTPPVDDIEQAFGITLDEAEVLEFYTMRVDEVARRSVELRAE